MFYVLRVGFIFFCLSVVFVVGLSLQAKPRVGDPIGHDLALYEQLNNPDGATIIAALEVFGPGLAKGRLSFYPKAHADWVLDTLIDEPPYDLVYHILTPYGEPITPTAVWVDGHKSKSSGWLAVTFEQEGSGLQRGMMTYFVVDHRQPHGGGPNLFAIDAR